MNLSVCESGHVRIVKIQKRCFVLGCENWERYDFKALLRLVKSFIVLIWETRENKLYGDQDGTGETSGYSCSCSLTRELTSSACVCGCVVDGVSATAAT